MTKKFDNLQPPTKIEKPLVELTNQELRINLLAKALTDQDTINQGRTKYTERNNNNSDWQHYLENDSITLNTSIGSDHYRKVSGEQLEQSTTEIANQLSIAYGVFRTSIENGDIATAIQILSNHSDLSFHPQICQMLESATAHALSESGLVDNLANEIANNSISRSLLEKLDILSKPVNGETPPPESVASLNHIIGFSTVVRGINVQREFRQPKENSATLPDAYTSLTKFVQKLSTPLASEGYVDKYNQINTYIRDRYDDLKKDNRLEGEKYTDTLLQLSNQNFFAELPPNIQQEIKLHLLGNIIGLAQHAVDAADSSQVNPAFIDNRINIITQLLEPIITADNFPTENPGDLQNLEATAIWQIFTTLDQKPQLSQQLKQKLEEIISRKSKSTSPVENKPEPQPEPGSAPVETPLQPAEPITPLGPEPEIAPTTIKTQTEKPHQSEATAEQLHQVAILIAELPTYKATIRGTKPEDIVNRIHQFRQTKLSNLPDTDPLIIMLEMTQAEIRKKY